MRLPWVFLIGIMALFAIDDVLAAINSGQIVQQIHYAKNRLNQTVIVIQFDSPVRYLRHFPEHRGARLDIHVTHLNLSPLEANYLPLEETRLGPKNDFVPLLNVTYDGFNSLDPMVVVNFTREVEFSVRQINSRAIYVSLTNVPFQEAKPSLLMAEKPSESTPATVPSDPIPLPDIKEPEIVKPLKIAPNVEKQMVILMNQGKTALTRGDHRAAIQLFTQVLSVEKHAYTPLAQELLGVARERNQQIAHAKKVYEDYLALYPKGEDHERVKQRLASLARDEKIPLKKLKQPITLVESGVKTDFFGSFSMYDYGFNDKYENLAKLKSENTLQTFINLNARMRTKRIDLSSYFDGVAVNEISTAADEKEEVHFEVNSMYVDLKDEISGYLLKFGRQPGNSGGIFGRFDGMTLGYHFTPRFNANLVAGYSVDFSNKDTIQTNIPFYGINFGLGDFFENLDVTPYYFYQEVDGIVNRHAVGLESRFFMERVNLFSLLDYDISYQDLNIALLYGLFEYNKRLKYTVNIDIRNNPLIQTTVALYSSPELLRRCPGNCKDIASMLRVIPEQEIRDRSRDLTGSSKLYSIGVNYDINPFLQFNADISQTLLVSKFEAPEEQDPITLVQRFFPKDDNLNQYALSLQLMISELFKKHDSTILGVRLSDDKQFEGVSLTLSNRVGLTPRFNLASRVFAEYRAYAVIDTAAGYQQYRVQPSFKLDYRFNRNFEIQTEISYYVLKYNQKPNADNSQGYYFSLGYRWDF